MQTVTKRTTVDVDTRRSIIVLARGRKPNDVAKMPHEAFIRRLLKQRMGWGMKENAPESIKLAAKQMAAAIIAEEKARRELAEKAVAEFKAKHEPKT
jgi:hypothetical protein